MTGNPDFSPLNGAGKDAAEHQFAGDITGRRGRLFNDELASTETISAAHLTQFPASAVAGPRAGKSPAGRHCPPMRPAGTAFALEARA